MAWDLLDAHITEQVQLELYTQGMKEFMIRFDGIELMNSLLHSSEDVLGELAIAFCERPDARILIGGLGLGFTLAATLRAQQQLPSALAATISIQVAELMPQIIRWFQQYFCQSLQLEQNCAQLRAIDAYQAISQDGPWRVICLDIDNGPSYLSTNDNQKMYECAGLQQIYQHLDEDGVCLVWSANEESSMVAQAAAQQFFVYLRYVHSQLAARVFEQYIYVLSRQALSAQFCQQWQLHPMPSTAKPN